MTGGGTTPAPRTDHVHVGQHDLGLRLEDGHRHQRRRRNRDRHVHGHQGHHRSERAERATSRRTLVHESSVPLTISDWHRRRLRPRHVQRPRRARVGDADQRRVRHVRLVGAGHTRRRRRHERDERQLLPLPLRVTDNVGNSSGASTASADAKVDTTAPALALTVPTAVTGTAQLVLARRHRPSTTTPGPNTGVVHRQRHLDRRAVRHRAASPSRTSPGRAGGRLGRRQRHGRPVLVADRLHLDGGRNHRLRLDRRSPPSTAPASTASDSFTVTNDTTAPTGQSVRTRRRPVVHEPSVAADDRLGQRHRLRTRHLERRRRARLAPH